jgi:hypothetical protein
MATSAAVSEQEGEEGMSAMPALTKSADESTIYFLTVKKRLSYDRDAPGQSSLFCNANYPFNSQNQPQR